MPQDSDRITLLGELLACANDVYCWRFSRDMFLEYTNCPDAHFFESTLQFSGCSDQITDHFGRNTKPILLSDMLGLIWLAACESKSDEVKSIHLIGPAFSSDFSEKNLTQKLDNMNISLSVKNSILKRLYDVPVILHSSFSRYGIMLHYCLNGEKISSSDIVLSRPTLDSRQNAFENWIENKTHSTWFYEQQLLQIIRQGDMCNLEKLSHAQSYGRPGLMCPGDPLRQAKDEIIVLTALSTRAAIEGGLLPETAYTLSDYYVQMIESCATVSETLGCAKDVLVAFTERVQKKKISRNYSMITQKCISYIQRNIMDKVSIEEMAAEIGYAKYYLTAKFKEDMGVNLRDYISQQKVEQAKLLLSSTELSVSEIGSRLGFVDSSYFSAVFKKWTGTQPSEYRFGS